MYFPVRLSFLASLLTLGATAPAGALPIHSTPSQLPSNPDSSFLIAAPFRKEVSPAYQRRKKLMEMLVMQMEISEAAEEFLKSDDPNVKQLAQEMIDSSENRSSQILKMLSPESPSTSQER